MSSKASTSMLDISPHLQKIDALRQEVELELQGKPELQFFCSDETCLRYLRARAMDVHKAAKMLKETLRWCGNMCPA